MLYYLHTPGCQMNISDGERIRTLLNKSGHSEVKDMNDAEVLGIVACTVREQSIEKVYHKAKTWQKEDKKRITFLTGCLLERDKERLSPLFDYVLTTEETINIPSLLNTVEGGERETTIKDFWHIDPSYGSSWNSFIPIQNGCDNFCSYCAVPYTRGREVSRPHEEIEAEFLSLLEKGVKSVTLLGQNVNSYQKESIKEEEITPFAKLLDRLGELGDNYRQKTGNLLWIYFTAPHPRDMKFDIIDVMAKWESIAKQIHLPLQSGDNKILADMNRSYTQEDYRQIVHKLREKMPHISLFTDIIVGYPKEGEEEFNNTKLFMQEMHFDMAYIARYSPRKGTVSAKEKDAIPQHEKKKRFEQLSQIFQQTAHQNHLPLEGKTVPVILEKASRKGETWEGRTEGKIPVRVTLKNNFTPEEGDDITVLIEEAKGLSLQGKQT